MAGCFSPARPSSAFSVHSAPRAHSLFNPALAETLLEGQKRDRWQKPGQIIAALSLKPGEAVADLGAGSGYFLPFLSRAVGKAGRVYAEEVQEEFLAPLQKRADQLRNVRLVLGREDDPKLPSPVDCLFLVTVYHEVENGADFLKALHRFARPRARLVLIDFDPARKGPYPAPKGHAISEKTVISEAASAGWTLKRRYEFLGSQFFLVFQ